LFACTFFVVLEVQRSNWFLYDKQKIEHSQGSYIHEEEFIGLHVNMGNGETESNGRRDIKDPVTMRGFHREVNIYRDDNERIMNTWEEILHILNMFAKESQKGLWHKSRS
jgi:hypothetical protein